MQRVKKIGIIGFGNIGSSLGRALRDRGWKVYAYDKERRKLKKKDKLYICKDSPDLIEKVPILIIAIKPQDILHFLKTNKVHLKTHSPLIISILAGTRIRLFEKLIGKVKVIRCMPNLAVKERQSISFLSRGAFATPKDLTIAKEIFNCVGQSLVIEERFLDKVTAISGSGPGYLYYFMNCLYESARMLGFKSDIARNMTIATVQGAVSLLKDSKDDFSVWLGRVTSRGGTTEAAVKVLNRGKVDQTMKKAVKAAYVRAKQLSRGG
jgi:pyrroline-5-carboxylate reductase